MHISIGKNSLEKHYKYESIYKKNTIYWGLGIENELYLQFDKEIEFSHDKFLNNHRRERYSVDYFTNYKPEIINQFLPLVPYNHKLPLILNSHSFSKTDRFNNPRSTYAKNPELNPNFTKTLWEFVEENNEYIKENFNKSFVFDGDTIELITLNFFNVTLDNLIDEYLLTKNNFIENIREVFDKNGIFEEYGRVGYMMSNHPFAVHMTNMNNMTMFNNGTLHFNGTLPTKLGIDGKIEDKDNFLEIHRNYIKVIQFLEPLFLCIYGQPDPLSFLPNQQLKFSACSQRNAVSRYIGVGTYDSDTMKPGKILTEPADNLTVAKESYGWYNKYYHYCGYNRLDQLGMDINFNKHYNHGVEVRIFEHLTDVEQIKDICKMLIYLGDFSLENEIKENPIKLELWNDVVIRCMNFGRKAEFSDKELDLYKKIFKHNFCSTSAQNLYFEIFQFLQNRYQLNGRFSRYAMQNSYFEAEKKAQEILENAEAKAKQIILEANSVMEKAEMIKKEADLYAEKIIRETEENAKRMIQETKRKMEKYVIDVKTKVSGVKREVQKNTSQQINSTQRNVLTHVNDNVKNTLEQIKIGMESKPSQENTHPTERICRPSEKCCCIS